MTERVSTEVVEDGTLLRLTFERERGNVLTGSLMRSLHAALEEHAFSPTLKLVALEGMGENFSYGASVEEHEKERAPEMLATFHALVRRLVTYPVPVAAVVRGRCFGGAFELVLGCHLVFGSNDAVFACPEVQLGVFAPVLAALGPLRLGLPLTERLALTGAELHAREAERAGFATLIADDPARALLEFHRANFERVSAFALRQTLEAVRRGSGVLQQVGETLAAIEKQYLTRVVTSYDGNEGVAAFLEKRPPRWRHA